MEITKEILERLYTQENKTCKEVGLVLGKSPAEICRKMKKFGIKGRVFIPSTKGRIMPDKQKDILRQQHLGKKLTSEHRAKVIKSLCFGKFGKENPNYKGGSYINDWGYVMIRKNGKYVSEHRTIMENHLGRKLSPNENIHHLNHNKQDNRIENLLIINPSEHSSLHHGTIEARKKKSEQLKTARSKRFWSTKKKI